MYTACAETIDVGRIDAIQPTSTSSLAADGAGNACGY